MEYNGYVSIAKDKNSSMIYPEGAEFSIYKEDAQDEANDLNNDLGHSTEHIWVVLPAKLIMEE